MGDRFLIVISVIIKRWCLWDLIKDIEWERGIIEVREKILSVLVSVVNNIKRCREIEGDIRLIFCFEDRGFF